MKGFIAVAALVGAVLANPMPQASTPAGCSSTQAGTFEITTVNVTKSAKRDLVNRQADGTLVLTLNAGILKDAAGRTGYIAANRQFQFDNPIQAGAVITSGWSICSNGSLSLSGSAIFFQCLSGTFYNLYDKSQGAQCNSIYIVASTASSSSAAATGTATTKVTQLSDGQPQATSAKVSQISDGQPQATTGTAKVSQISDGQIQASTGAKPTSSAAKVSQISDGQIQASTGAAKTTSSAAKVSQISDGQIQAPTSTAAKVSQISDGQIQAPTSTGAKVSQISDGQVQAATSTRAIATFTGAARREAAGGFAFVAGIVGAVALL